MLRYLVLFVLAASCTPGDAERCSAYRDRYGRYHEGFNCPDYSDGDDYDERYCCGTSRRKYCCDDCEDKVNSPCRRSYFFSIGGKVGVGLAVFGCVMILTAIAYCCRAKKLRQRNQPQQTNVAAVTTSYPGPEQSQYPQGAVSSLFSPAGGYPKATTSNPGFDQNQYPQGAMSYPPNPAGGYPPAATTAYPQPPPAGFVAAPPPYPGADAAYPPAYPGGPAYPEKQQ